MRREDPADQSDARLVLAIGRWDQGALGEAYRRHGGSVFALARRLGGVAMAHDIVQEVFLRLWQHPERFDPERGSLRSYLLAQGHSKAIDTLRSETARGHRERLDARRTARGAYGIEDEIVDLTVGEQVNDVLSTLPDGQRQAIELAYFGGLSYREVAEALDEPEGTIKGRIRAGLKRLRAGLETAGIGGIWNQD